MLLNIGGSLAIVGQSGALHKLVWTAEAQINGKTAVGDGSSKMKAMQEAARTLFLKLGNSYLFYLCEWERLILLYPTLSYPFGH